jgi:hypothetical protein
MVGLEHTDVWSGVFHKALCIKACSWPPPALCRWSHDWQLPSAITSLFFRLGQSPKRNDRIERSEARSCQLLLPPG